MKQYLIAAMTAVALSYSFVSLAADKSPTPAEQEKAYQQYMEKMQAHMKLMQEQMTKIQQSKDPKERERLMQEHWTAMQDGMKWMHGTDSMPGCGMMMGGSKDSGTAGGSCCMGGGQHMMGNQGHMMGGKGHMMGWWNPKDDSMPAMNRRQQMLQGCMGIQQNMMDQMMWRQNWQNQMNRPAK
jgi:hypothetical protein